MHSTYNDIIYKKNEEVAMGQSLGLTLARMFLINLENNITPKLKGNVTFCRRFADDIVAFVTYQEATNIDMKVYRNLKNTDPYLNWNFDTPTTWQVEYSEPY